MAFDFKSITGPLADFVVAELDANKTQALALIAQSEGGVEGAIVNALKTLPKPGGLLGVVFPQLEGALQKYASSIVAQYGPEVVFAFVDREVKQFAAQLGG